MNSRPDRVVIDGVAMPRRGESIKAVLDDLGLMGEERRVAKLRMEAYKERQKSGRPQSVAARVTHAQGDGEDSQGEGQANQGSQESQLWSETARKARAARSPQENQAAPTAVATAGSHGNRGGENTRGKTDTREEASKGASQGSTQPPRQQSTREEDREIKRMMHKAAQMAELKAYEEQRTQLASKTTQVKMGRPSTYSEAEADRLCEWVQNGGSLNRWCRDNGRSAATIYSWMRERPDFQKRYAQAHEDRSDTMTDEMLEIADSLGAGSSLEEVQAAKLRIETRKWIAAKLRPTKWGDKQIIEHQGGGVSINIGIPQRPATVIEAQEVTAVRRLPDSFPDSDDASP